MRVVFIILALTLTQFTYAQEEENSKLWFDGDIWLRDGLNITGKTIYDLREQKVKVRYGEDIREIPVSLINNMTLTSEEGTTHEFLLVAIKEEGAIKPKLKFAEILYRSENNFSLFREYGANTFRVVNDDPFFYTPRVVSIRKNEKKDSFREKNNSFFSRRTDERFLLDYEGNRLAADKYGVLTAYRQWTKQLKKYASKNNLSFKREEDLIEILKYADKLASEEE